MKYLHLFKTKQEHDTAYQRGGEYKEPWVAYTEESKKVSYNLPHDYAYDYLTFKALEDGTFKFSGNAINYSLDSGKTWTELASDTDTPTVIAGGNIMWKAKLTPTNTGIGNFSSSGRYEAMGNICSLLFLDNFENANNLGDSGGIGRLFKNSTGITSADKLIFPAKTLNNYCYRELFAGCSSLTTAPRTLPATTLANSCYDRMFSGCTSLTTAPELPATTLAQLCYFLMFKDCTSLTTSPELPATILVNSCYTTMFGGCTSLTTAPRTLPATTLANSCYYCMFSGCTSLTAAPELPATTLAQSCYNGMFSGCTSLTTAPALPATTLVDLCYKEMFFGCTSLNYIKAMFTTTPSTTYTQNWVSGVASTGTFVKNSAATWNVTGTNGIPTGWSVETAST